MDMISNHVSVSHTMLSHCAQCGVVVCRVALVVAVVVAVAVAVAVTSEAGVGVGAVEASGLTLVAAERRQLLMSEVRKQFKFMLHDHVLAFAVKVVCVSAVYLWLSNQLEGP
jgi:hypothetical protein